ncbi:MAG: thiamine-monophosphate kinase, partial [Candidatus Omnitrophica bacterium]|nr:thiamine-monophosphate kinase [Candidatus Omnitrophota bacterium]
MPAQTIKQLGEFHFIDRIQKKIKYSHQVVHGLGDDTAVVAHDRHFYGLWTTDMLIEGGHFTSKDDPADIGHKSLACSISDVAAMGGLPKYALVSLGMPSSCPVKYIDRLYAGILKTARVYDTDIIGGDTVRSDKIIINVCVYGTVHKKHLVTRSAAKTGDVIFVTGPLGDSFRTKKH